MAQTSDNLSRRAQENLQLIMPKIKGVVTERKNHDTEVIDLSTAENWLLRAELLPICQTAIKDHFQIDVSGVMNSGFYTLTDQAFLLP